MEVDSTGRSVLETIGRSDKVEDEADAVSPPRQSLAQLSVTTVRRQLDNSGEHDRQQRVELAVRELVDKLQHVAQCLNRRPEVRLAILRHRHNNPVCHGHY